MKVLLRSFSDVKWTSFLVRCGPTRQELVRNSSEIDHHVRNWSQNDKICQKHVRNWSQNNELCLKLVRKWPILSDYNISYKFTYIANISYLGHHSSFLCVEWYRSVDWHGRSCHWRGHSSHSGRDTMCLCWTLNDQRFGKTYSM